LLVVPLVYDTEIHSPFIKTNGVSLAKKERTMPSNCAHMNTHSKSSIVVETIKEGMKSLQLYQQYQTTSTNRKDTHLKKVLMHISITQ